MGMFLALSLVFLTSLWLKYGKQMAANDAENFGGCPVHKNKPSQAAKHEQKGKTQMAAKREYFQLVYKEIVVALHLNVLLFEDADQIPEELKQHTVSSRPSTSSVA